MLCCRSLFYYELTRYPLKPVAIVQVHLVVSASQQQIQKQNLFWDLLKRSHNRPIVHKLLLHLLVIVHAVWTQTRLGHEHKPLSKFCSLSSYIYDCVAAHILSPFHLSLHLWTAQVLFSSHSYQRYVAYFLQFTQFDFRANDRLWCQWVQTAELKVFQLLCSLLTSCSKLNVETFLL